MKMQMKISLLLALLLASFGFASAQSNDKIREADAEIAKARELLKQGYFDSAVVNYQKAFKIAPNYPKPYEELGELMLEKRNFAYAIQMYAKLGQLKPAEPKYQTVLFGLYDAYDAPSDALKSGESLVSMGEADQKLLKRMVELYKKTDNPKGQLRTMELVAKSGEVSAEYWNDIGQLYLSEAQYKDAVRSFQTALSADPTNAKYRNGLGLAYLNQNKLDDAEVIFTELSQASPNDKGLTDQLARLYALQGDGYLVNGRANTALEYYAKAESTGNPDKDPKDKKTTDADATRDGVTAGTVNTSDQIYKGSNGSGIGVGQFRRGISGFTNFSDSLANRKRSAEILMHPQYLFNADFGTQDVNNYTVLDNVVRIPIRGTELDLRVRHSYRDVSSGIGGSASREYFYGGFNYNFNKNWSALAYVGTDGFYDATALYEGDTFRGGFNFKKDVWNFTPRALGTDLTYDKQGLFGGISIGDRWSIDGAIDWYSFRDGVDQTIYSIGPSYQLIFEPGVQEWQISYEHAGQSNSAFVDPNLRFAPRNLKVDTIGTEYTRVMNDWWRLKAGYFYSWINNGTSGSSYLIGSDFQVWEGAWLGLEYTDGNFSNGAIPANLQGLNNGNNNLNVNFGVSF